MKSKAEIEQTRIRYHQLNKGGDRFNPHVREQEKTHHRSSWSSYQPRIVAPVVQSPNAIVIYSTASETEVMRINIETLRGRPTGQMIEMKFNPSTDRIRTTSWAYLVASGRMNKREPEFKLIDTWLSKEEQKQQRGQ